MSKSSQKNTIFNYFVKSPSTGNTTPKNGAQSTSVSAVASPAANGASSTTPRRPTLTPSNKDTPKLKVKKGFALQTPIQKTINATNFTEVDLVWAKLDGYPWWPSLVCQHPVKKMIQLKGKVHVQFFDDPPTRSWIDERFVKPYSGAKNIEELGCSKPQDDNWEKACIEADKALGMTVVERLKLITCLVPSDDEEENSVISEDSKSTPKNSRSRNSKSTTSAKGPQPKRRRILSCQSDDEDEYKPEDVTMESSSSEEASLVEEDENPSEGEEEEDESPVKRKRKIPAAKAIGGNKNLSLTGSDSPSVSLGTKKKLTDFSCKTVDGAVCGSQDEGRNFSHLALEWLKPENIRDAKGRKPDDLDYDPRTLYVPEKFKQGLTPAMRQWWELKAKHFDVVLFFKMGKFYELYHTDALLAVKELGIILMKGDHAHCGFPERAFAKHSSLLIERGYKVARVEQTETPEMCNDRVKKTPRATKFDKVVQRELCQITSIGTRTFNVMEGDSWQVEHHFLMALWEKCEGADGSSGGRVEFGVAFVDTSIGTFHLGQFVDDRYRSRLSTLLTRFHPVEIISARRSISAETRQVWSTACPSALHEQVSPNADCWDTAKTLRALAEGECFKVNGELDWPEGLRPMLDGNSTLGLAASEDSELAIRALGAIHWYLKECQLDQELFSRRSFQIYQPLDGDTQQSNELLGKHLVLDGMTLRNLDVLANSSTGTIHGSLLERLNRCSTPFGQRMLRHWLCAPLCQPEAIEERLDAVEYLSSNPAIMDGVGKVLKSLPDLERLVNKIHGQGSSLRARNHPDSRAILFDGPLYSKKKIADFLLTLEGFRSAQKVEELFKSETIVSELLRRCVKSAEQGGQFPDMTGDLEFFQKAFDHQQAAKEGKMIPRPGVDAEYDQALERIAEIERQAEQYLVQQKSHFGCKVTYVGTEKKRFQLEVPESAARKADSRYELQGQRKGFKRYYTEESRDLIHRLMAAEEMRDSALKDIARRIFEQFDQRHLLWEKAIECLSILDVLTALAAYASDQRVCRPRVVRPSAQQPPYLKMIQGRHPAHSQLFVNSEFIPNDVHIGSSIESQEGGDLDQQHSLTLVTGPNMGGKSTLMRQVGLCVILAQMGSFVPAEEFELTPVDRLFTRLGANDHILGGESTFFVELSETAAILKHATIHSLVLLDELGRGTSTFDGTAIAYSVVDHLADRRCRTLFSTHYHSLVRDLTGRPQVRLGHMACMAENEEQVEDPSQESIIFLYQFVAGACPKSYGFHAARLAGLDPSIISHGYQRAKDMEMKMTSRQLFRDLFQPASLSEDFKPDWSCLAI